VHSGDRAETRRTHPGALHLARWRAIQLAIREGSSEMDLGGADLPGARREPVEGEPMWGLYQHKLGFGGRWLELAGAHERVIRPRRYAAGRLAARVARLVRR
jgi:lipid II:glycine glycyltransferase (peptidoglycan interpeptide bridge formation enzyme)